MAPVRSANCSPRPVCVIKVPAHMKQSAERLTALHEGNQKNTEKKSLKQHRTQQEEELAAETQVHDGQGPGTGESHTPETQSNDTTNASVNASISHDPILLAILEEEHEQKALVEWLRKRYPGRDLSTLDMEELQQLCAECGLGPTLQRNHNPYPNRLEREGIAQH
ncbi:hypothetical protein FRC06_011676 [Ceratobasidium sp. 370]|nr:hypothetical protein FRC06_011676 [Ceratobasidium sp. 370]